MKAKHLLFVVAGCCMGFAMSGCKANVDLKNIDKTAELDMGIALPVGSMSATIGDFLADGQVPNIYVDSLNNKGILTFKDTFSIDKKYHQVDLSQYISEKTLTMNVYDKLQGTPELDNHQITGDDNKEITLAFPLTLKLKGINNNENNERLDSALIENAHFVSTIVPQNLPLKWEWINSVSIDLGSAFSRPQGKNVVVYSKGNGYGYGQDIPISVTEFTINLMKNRTPATPEAYFGNVIDTCDFVIYFNFTVPTSAGKVTIADDAAFEYHLGVQFIDYKAIWGMFTPSKDMYDEDTVNIAEEWAAWRQLKKAKLPFAEPVIDMQITTQVAGALMLQGDYLFVETEDKSQKRYATFNGNQTLYRDFSPDEYLSLTSTIGDSATMHVRFDNTDAFGHIDRLFAIRPDFFGYKFSIDFNRQRTPQIRITPNTGIYVDAIATLPFIFNEGVGIEYSDTIKDIDISRYTLDSLLASVDMIDTLKTSDLKLIIKITNSIPLDIKGVFYALDENGNVVTEPDDPTKAYRLTASDTIRIQAPTYRFEGGTAIPMTSEQTEILSIDKKHFDTFSKIKSIVYTASIDDESLQSAYQHGGFNVRIAEDNKLKVQLGLTAKVDAIFDLDNITVEK